jgi:hypothetical protein
MLKHQIKMLNYLNINKCGALLCEMRTQKTLPMIKHIETNKLFPTLILCPNAAINGWKYWINEGYKFKYTYIINNFDIENLSTINIYNIEKIRVNPNFLNEINWKCIILDESQCIINPKSLLSKFLLNQKITSVKTKIKKLSNFKSIINAEYKYILTGTPIENSELGFFNQFKFINLISQDLSYYQFRMKYFYLSGFQWKINNNGKKFINDCLDKTLQLLREDIGYKDKKIYLQRVVQPCFEFKRIYKKVKNEFILEYKKEEKFTKWVLQKYIWLRKLCGGFIEDEFKFNQKIKELDYLLKTELKDKKIIIRCEFKQEVNILKKYFNKINVENISLGGDNTIQHNVLLLIFKIKKSLLICICTNDVLNQGTDLSFVDTLIFYSTPESSIQRKQIEDRHISLEKTESILIIDLLFEKSLDIHILKNLKRKYAKQKFIKKFISEY